MKHKRVNVKMKKTNNCIGVGTTIERDNRRTSKKFLLSYRFNEVKECQGTLCQRAVSASVKVSISRSKKKGRLVAKDCDNKL